MQAPPKARPILFSGSMIRAILNGQKTMTRRVIKPQPPECAEGALVVKNPAYGGSAVVWTRESGIDVLLGTQYDGETYKTRQRWECPYGQPGDLLWVKETFYAFGRWETRFSQEKGRDEWHFIDLTLESGHAYQFSEPDGYRKMQRGGVIPSWWKRPSIYMPRWASRLTLHVTDVRVERVQAISEADVIAEGLVRLSKDGGRTWKYGIPDRDGSPGEDNDGWHWHRWRMSPVDAFQSAWESINGRRPGCLWDDNPWCWVVGFERVGATTPHPAAEATR